MYHLREYHIVTLKLFYKMSCFILWRERGLHEELPVPHGYD